MKTKLFFFVPASILLLLLNCKIIDQIITDRTSYIYNGDERVPITYSDTLFMAVLAEKPDEAAGKIIAGSLRRSGVQRDQIAGRDLYFQAANAELAQLATDNMKRDGLAVTGFYPAIVGLAHPIFIGDDLVIKLKADADVSAFSQYLATIGATQTESYELGMSRYVIAKVNASAHTVATANSIQESGWSVISQPNFRVHAKPAYIPNDSRFDNQQTRLESIKLPQAWDITKGSTDIAVAVFDSGFELDHPDLGNNIVAPYDAFNDDDDPEPESEKDNHGTPVLGIVGADTDNAIGVAGVGFNIKVVPVKIAITVECFLFGGDCMYTDCASVGRAADHVVNTPNLNVAAVNNSYLIYDSDFVEACWENVFTDMHQSARNGKGAAIIAATGNDGAIVQSGFPVKFPVSIGVGELNFNGFVDSNSNYGPLVDIVAPGGLDALDRQGDEGYGDGNYQGFYGTSAASPVVAGVAGLVASVNPQLTGEEIGRILLHSADYQVKEYEVSLASDHIVGLKSEKAGYGRVNAFNAVKMASRNEIPLTVYPVLYTNSSADDQLVEPQFHFLDREPDKVIPAASDLQVDMLTGNTIAFPGEYLLHHFLLEGESMLYRAGSDGEIIQRFDLFSGEAETVYSGQYQEGSGGPDIVLAYYLNAAMMVKYFAASGIEEIYRLDVNAADSTISMVKLQETALLPDNNYRYAYFSSGLNYRLVRFSPAECKVDFVQLDAEGIPVHIWGPYVYDDEDCPELWAFYRGKNTLFMYSQPDPYEYRITRVDINGAEIHSESHSSSFSDTPFDYLTVHHLYDPARPYFFFWDNRGAVKVKALQLSDYQLNPFAVHMKAFSSPGSPQPFWTSATFIK